MFMVTFTASLGESCDIVNVWEESLDENIIKLDEDPSFKFVSTRTILKCTGNMFETAINNFAEQYQR